AALTLARNEGGFEKLRTAQLFDAPLVLNQPCFLDGADVDALRLEKVDETIGLLVAVDGHGLEAARPELVALDRGSQGPIEVDADASFYWLTEVGDAFYALLTEVEVPTVALGRFLVHVHRHAADLIRALAVTNVRG